MAIEKGSDGRWLVDGQPIVIQTTRDEDGLMFQEANIDGEELTELINSHTFVEAQNQHGERVELSFDMDGESLIVKDEKELLEESRAIEAQRLKQQTGIKTEVIKTLLRHHDEWLEMTRKNSNVLIGERMIVIDKHGRAFSQTMENGESAIKLSQPNSNLIGVSMLTAEQANKVVAHLEQRWPEMAPYVAWDFQDFAKAECDKIQGLLTLIRNAAEASQLAIKEEGASPNPAGAKAAAAPHTPPPVGAAESPNTLFVVLAINDTGNEAFGDMGRAEEVARIITEAAERMYEQPPGLLQVGFPLRDINGNKVGSVEVSTTPPEGDVSEGGVRLVIETGNAAFDEEPAGEIARIWRGAAEKVQDGSEAFWLLDMNGNIVGSYTYQAPLSLAHDGVIDMAQALAESRVWAAEEGFTGLAEGEYRYVITGPDFAPGYGQFEGEVWLVNAKGEIASGYEDRKVVSENLINVLTKDQLLALQDVVEKRVTFEEHERRITGDDPELS